jgi:hypothetical protein
MFTREVILSYSQTPSLLDGGVFSATPSVAVLTVGFDMSYTLAPHVVDRIVGEVFSDNPLKDLVFSNIFFPKIGIGSRSKIETLFILIQDKIIGIAQEYPKQWQILAHISASKRKSKKPGSNMHQIILFAQP